MKPFYANEGLAEHQVAYITWCRGKHDNQPLLTAFLFSVEAVATAWLFVNSFGYDVPLNLERFGFFCTCVNIASIPGLIALLLFEIARASGDHLREIHEFLCTFISLNMPTPWMRFVKIASHTSSLLFVSALVFDGWMWTAALVVCLLLATSFVKGMLRAAIIDRVKKLTLPEVNALTSYDVAGKLNALEQSEFEERQRVIQGLGRRTRA